ncbi:serine/threonine-protein kinase [Streptomyces radiopugnans]|uniref:non-specific serine/threonine protein kinase n=1 Tax=Streptomyces radiopugnans TaxID=403935 RepID=A0A1H9B6R5_9ACTN|nr:serine/threonine-protein kinase [Streptomyces radiopugnans]SEP84716.1 serine/threonine-protein kinase PknG [Streptomyces radiopugnans]
MNGRGTADRAGHGADHGTGHGGPADERRRLLALPPLPPPGDPAALVLTDPVPPLDGRPCGKCGNPVGRPYRGMPARQEGYCPRCGTRYSLRPQLGEGELLDGGRYEVRGPLAHGGLGWVYLAVDTRLRNRPIVLKGVLNPHDDEARESMLEERNQMIAVSHESIVRILDYVHHRPGDGGIDADYIVMEYVGGKSLQEVLDETARGLRPLGPDEPLTLEHVARYGCQILDALAALHEQGLVHSDMKPANVIHRGTRVVLIDLGGARRPDGSARRAPVITPDYAAPEVRSGGGPTVAHDIHTVGRTLEELSGAAVDGAPGAHGTGLGHISFHRLVERATDRDPARRFSSAAEMSGQLERVLRELLSLRTGRPYNRPSDVFEPTPTLLDAGLGAVPGLENWRGRRVRDYRRTVTAPVLRPGRPAPSAVAAGLPAPLPRPDDPAAVQLRMPGPTDPRAVVRQLERLLGGDGPGTSAEVRLRLCRAHLAAREELPPEHTRDRGRELEGAERRLRETEAALGLAPDARPAPDWRIAWHRGLVRLAREEVGRAEGHFAEVYGALPGEYAPKLALGYCAEHRGEPERAERFYHAVWRRNPQQGSAAFGLARVHLARGDRERAAEVLDGVAPTSRHYDAARIAAVRIRAARLTPGPGDRSGGLPDWRGLAVVREELPGLELDGGAGVGPERTRLTAEIREWALDWIQRVAGGVREAGGAGAGAGGRGADGVWEEDRAHLAELTGELFGGGRGEPPTERGLRTLLSWSFHDLARLPGTTPEQHEHLEDCSNAVFPRTWFVRPGGRRDRRAGPRTTPRTNPRTSREPTR